MFNKRAFWTISFVIIFISSYSAFANRDRNNITAKSFGYDYNQFQNNIQDKIDSLEGRTEALEDEKSILLIEMGNRKHKIEKLRSDSANHIVQLNLENSRSESLSESMKYLFIIILFFVLFVLIQFGIIFYAIKRITSNNQQQSNSSDNFVGHSHSNPQLESLEMLKNKGFISEEEYFRQRQSLMSRQA